MAAQAVKPPLSMPARTQNDLLAASRRDTHVHLLLCWALLYQRGTA
jgi:hypothetical protein